MKHIIPCLALSLTTSAAMAETVTVTFADGAPKDRITFTNTGCPLTAATIVIDLSGSTAGLIFDTTAGGDGVEVFQPVEALTPDISISPIADGGQVLHVYVPDFPTGATFALTADLDDTTSNRQITVSGSEMAGATVSVAYGTSMQSAPFNDAGIAALPLPPTADGCLSA